MRSLGRNDGQVLPDDSMVGSGRQSVPLCLPSRKVDDMKRVLVAIGRLARNTDGQDLLEYGLLAALIAVVAVVGITNVGQAIYTLFWRDIGNAI